MVGDFCIVAFLTLKLLLLRMKTDDEVECYVLSVDVSTFLSLSKRIMI